jgi:hypothetical protein
MIELEVSLSDTYIILEAATPLPLIPIEMETLCTEYRRQETCQIMEHMRVSLYVSATMPDVLGVGVRHVVLQRVQIRCNL